MEFQKATCQANVQVTCLLLVKGTVWRDSDHKSTCENEPEFTFPLGVVRQVSYHPGIHIIQHQHWFFWGSEKETAEKRQRPHIQAWTRSGGSLSGGE